MQYCNDIYQQLFFCFSCGLKAAHFMPSGLAFLLILQSKGVEKNQQRMSGEMFSNDIFFYLKGQ